MAGLVLPSIPGELVIAPDGDDAGRTAANKLANRAMSAGWRVRVMDCPDGRDWNDIMSEVAA
jgi:DNA primase